MGVSLRWESLTKLWPNYVALVTLTWWRGHTEVAPEFGPGEGDLSLP
jgi:hypothetical protein